MTIDAKRPPKWPDCEELTGLWTLNKGEVLLWPTQGFPDDNPRVRARWTPEVCYVVDFDNPQEKRWCAGQRYKLRPVTEEDGVDAPSPIRNGIAISEMMQIGYIQRTSVTPKAVEDKVNENKDAATEPVSTVQSVRPKTTQRKES